MSGKITTRTVRFGGMYVNQHAISRAQGIDQGYLSCIFNGKKTPSIMMARKIAAAIGMDMETFFTAIDERREENRRQAEKIFQQHHNRVVREISEDQARAAVGLPVLPRLPGLRIA